MTIYNIKHFDGDGEYVKYRVDSKIKKYSGFSNKKPMNYVGYDKSKEKYEFKLDKIKKCLKNKEAVCTFALENLKGNFEPSVFEISLPNKACIPYKNNVLIAFAKDDEPLFDILHIY